MTNLDKIAECARIAVVFYDNDDKENYITALRVLYERMTKKDPSDLLGFSKEGRNDNGVNENNDTRVWY